MPKPYSQEQGQDQESASESALIPKSLVPEGIEPGGKITFKFVHIYEDEVEVVPSGSNDEDESESESESSEIMSAEDELDQLAKE